MHLTAVRYLGDFRLELTCSDGSDGVAPGGRLGNAEPRRAPKIAKRNRARCLDCNQVVENFGKWKGAVDLSQKVTCRCGQLDLYVTAEGVVRRGARYEELTEWEDEPS